MSAPPLNPAAVERELDRQTRRACGSPKDPVARTALAGMALDAGYQAAGQALLDPKAGRKLLADTWKAAEALDVSPSFLLLRVVVELPDLKAEPKKTAPVPFPMPTPQPPMAVPKPAPWRKGYALPVVPPPGDWTYRDFAAGYGLGDEALARRIAEIEAAAGAMGGFTTGYGFVDDSGG